MNNNITKKINFIIIIVVIISLFFTLIHHDAYASENDTVQDASNLIKKGELTAGKVIEINDVKFTVLDTDFSVGDNEKTGILLLDNEPAITSYEFGSTNNWETSVAKIYCKKFAIDKLKSLSTLLLRVYHKDNSSSLENSTGVNVDLTGERAFLLSSGELCKYKQYTLNYDIPFWGKSYLFGDGYDYWLRTKKYSDNKYSNVMYCNVTKNSIDCANCYSYKAIRPAIVVSKKIQLSKSQTKNIDYKYIIKFTVKFVTDGVNTIDSQTVTKGEKITKPVEPTKDGHIFDGWYKDKKLEKVWDFDKDIVTDNITLYAKFNEIEKFIVKFDTNRGGIIDSQTVTKGEKIIKPTDPFKPKHRFIGWFNDKEFNNLWDFDHDIVEGNLTLYAKFIRNYSVCYDYDGTGTIYLPADFIDNKIVKIAEPVKDGFVFRGWYYGPWYNHFKYKWDFENDVVTDDIILYPKFDKVESPPEPLKPDLIEPVPQNDDTQKESGESPDLEEPESDKFEPNSPDLDQTKEDQENQDKLSKIDQESKTNEQQDVRKMLDKSITMTSNIGYSSHINNFYKKVSDNKTGLDEKAKVKASKIDNTKIQSNKYLIRDVILVIILIIVIGLLCFFIYKKKSHKIFKQN